MSLEVYNAVVKVLSAPHTQANYPAVLVHSIVKAGSNGVPKIVIVARLAKANNSDNLQYFKTVPVFKRNKTIQSIVDIVRVGDQDVYYLKNWEAITPKERQSLMTLANKKAQEWECVKA